MTFTEFRTNEALRGWAEQFNQSREWLTLLDIMLKEQHPMYWQPSDSSASAAERQMGKIEGFNHALAVLAKAARKPAADPIRQIPVTFLSPNPPATAPSTNKPTSHVRAKR